MKPISVIVALAFLISINLPPSYGICDQGNLTIGALLPLSGDYASTGLSAKTALEHAEVDINSALSDIGRSARIHIVIKDTKTDPDATFEALKDLQVQGLRIIIGPEDSASLSRIREYANTSGIILISGSSTAPSLAIANDTIFRMTSDDTYLGNAIVALMRKDEVRAVVPIARDDLWGNDLINATAKSLNSEGGVMLNPIRFSSNTEDFSQALKDLRNSLKDAVNENGNGSVAVYLIAFDEATNILSQASGDELLSSVRWYGSDPSGILIQQDNRAAQFALKVHFIYPTFGQQNSPLYRKISEEVMQRYGIDMISYAINDYDAAWLIAYTYLVTGSDDPAAFKKMLPIFAKTYRGYSGDAVLNDAGDRAFAIYTFWSLNASNGIPQNWPMRKYVFNPYEGAYWSPVGDSS
jgi:branched-chain amino acid transport system substrate-binding protein